LETTEVDPVAYTCPPEGEPGYDIGDAVVDLAFSTCEGGQTTLHGECGSPTLILNVYGWCAPCIEHLNDAGELMAEYPELAVIAVINENPLSEPADADYCLQLRDFTDIGGTWLLDAEAQLEPYGGPGLALVLGGDGEVLFSRDDASWTAIREAVGEAVAP